MTSPSLNPMDPASRYYDATLRLLVIAMCLAFACGSLGWPQTGDLAPVVSKPVSKTIELPGEFQPFLSVSLHAKVPGYVERISVDRGSVVKQGQLLVELSAPEIDRADRRSGIQSAGGRSRTGCRRKRNSPLRRAPTSA